MPRLRRDARRSWADPRTNQCSRRSYPCSSWFVQFALVFCSKRRHDARQATRAVAESIFPTIRWRSTFRLRRKTFEQLDRLFSRRQLYSISRSIGHLNSPSRFLPTTLRSHSSSRNSSFSGIDRSRRILCDANSTKTDRREKELEKKGEGKVVATTIQDDDFISSPSQLFECV